MSDTKIKRKRLNHKAIVLIKVNEEIIDSMNFYQCVEIA